MKNSLMKKAPRKLFAAQKASGKPAQNFGLTEQEFENILKKMQNGEEDLFEQVFLSQFEDSIRYLMNTYNINRSTAYDATMDALLKFRRRLLANKVAYGNMRFLFTRMASQFFAESFKHKTVLLDSFERSLSEEEKLDEDVLDALDNAWGQLCDQCSKLLNRFYYQKVALNILALQSEQTESALRKQKQRCLEKLRMYFLKYYQS